MHNFCTWTIKGVIVIFVCVILKLVYKYTFRYHVCNYHIYTLAVTGVFLCMILLFAHSCPTLCPCVLMDTLVIYNVFMYTHLHYIFTKR